MYLRLLSFENLETDLCIGTAATTPGLGVLGAPIIVISITNCNYCSTTCHPYLLIEFLTLSLYLLQYIVQ